MLMLVRKRKGIVQPKNEDTLANFLVIHHPYGKVYCAMLKKKQKSIEDPIDGVKKVMGQGRGCLSTQDPTVVQLFSRYLDRVSISHPTQHFL